MTKLFRNKYRISSVRLAGYDYGSNGYYFVTICTKNRIPWFGDISGSKHYISDAGKITYETWSEIPAHFPFVQLDAFVVMPDHVHGIVIICKNDNDVCNGRGAINRASTIANTHTNIGGITGDKNPMLHENLPRILRWYKGRCTWEIRKILPDFAWQPRFYEHIIRSEQTLDNIRQYIRDNPANWNKGLQRK